MCKTGKLHCVSALLTGRCGTGVPACLCGMGSRRFSSAPSGLLDSSAFCISLAGSDGLSRFSRCLGSRGIAAASGRNSPNQALGAGTDQILPVGLDQRLFHQIIVFGIPVLDQRPLHGLLMGVRGDIDLLHGPGVQAGVVHDSGQGRGGGVEVLHLLRIVAHIPDVLRQLHGLLHGRAGMAGHEIGHQKLVHIVLLV